MSYPKIKLTEVLKILEKPEENNKPILLINPKGDLITFFTYKGNLKEIHKLKLKMQLHPEEKEQVEKEVRGAILSGMKMGGWTVFDMGESSTFDLRGFMKQFGFYEENMFLPDNLHNKAYCLKNKILTSEEDYDPFGNKGYFEVKNEFKLIFMSEIKEEEIPGLLSSLSVDFQVYFVQ